MVEQNEKLSYVSDLREILLRVYDENARFRKSFLRFRTAVGSCFMVMYARILLKYVLIYIYILYILK